MSTTFESRSQDLLALSIRANLKVEDHLRFLICEKILQEIQRGGGVLAESQIKFSRALSKAISLAAPKNKFAQALPGITSSFVERRETGMLERFLRVEGKIDRMKGTELFRLLRLLTEKQRVEEVLDYLDGLSP